jgi:hypothetical protein
MCGKKLPPETAFCPACGSNLKAPQTDRAPATTAKYDRTRLAAAVLIVYSLPLILFCFYMYLWAGTLAGMLFSDPEFYDLLVQFAPDVTEEGMISAIEMSAIAGMFSCALGIVTAALALARKAWLVTVIICTVFAISGIVTLIGLLVGLIALWLLYRSKESFAS